MKNVKHVSAALATSSLVSAGLSAVAFTNYAEKGNDHTEMLNIIAGNDPIIGALLAVMSLAFSYAAYNKYMANTVSKEKTRAITDKSGDEHNVNVHEQHAIEATFWTQVGLAVMATMFTYAIALGAASVLNADLNHDWTSSDLINGNSSTAEQAGYFVGYGAALIAAVMLFFRKPLAEKTQGMSALLSGCCSFSFKNPFKKEPLLGNKKDKADNNNNSNNDNNNNSNNDNNNNSNNDNDNDNDNDESKTNKSSLQH